LVLASQEAGNVTGQATSALNTLKPRRSHTSAWGR
jgi:hypothetical protein